MKSRSPSLVVAGALVLALVAAPGRASTGSGTVVESTTIEDCAPGSDGTCSTTALADLGGAFSGSVELDSPDSAFGRSNRYSIASPRYLVGFNLASPARQAELTVTLHLDEASASWVKDHPDVFSGTKSPSSAAEVSFILLGAKAPQACGCGWPAVGINDTVVVAAEEPGDSVSISDTIVRLTLTARNSSGEKLPAGHYEAFLRGFAMGQLVGTADWGTMHASMSGSIEDITVTTPTIATLLTLSVSGNGSRRALSALLTDEDGAAIAGRTIEFHADGASLGTALTATDGVATLPLQGRFRGGSYLFTAEFAGDDTYGGSSAEARS